MAATPEALGSWAVCVPPLLEVAWPVGVIRALPVATAVPLAAPRSEALALALVVSEAGVLALGLMLGLGLRVLPLLGVGAVLCERAELREGKRTVGEGKGVGLPLLLAVAQLEAETVGLR